MLLTEWVKVEVSIHRKKYNHTYIYSLAMSKTYTQVTRLDPYGQSFKITCYPKVYSLGQQIPHHYNELCKGQFCKDNNIDRKEKKAMYMNI